jgi:hypothetical protein
MIELNLKEREERPRNPKPSWDGINEETFNYIVCSVEMKDPTWMMDLRIDSPIVQ